MRTIEELKRKMATCPAFRGLVNKTYGNTTRNIWTKSRVPMKNPFGNAAVEHKFISSRDVSLIFSAGAIDFAVPSRSGNSILYC